MTGGDELSMKLSQVRRVGVKESNSSMASPSSTDEIAELHAYETVLVFPQAAQFNDIVVAKQSKVTDRPDDCIAFRWMQR